MCSVPLTHRRAGSQGPSMDPAPPRAGSTLQAPAVRPHRGPHLCSPERCPHKTGKPLPGCPRSTTLASVRDITGSLLARTVQSSRGMSDSTCTIFVDSQGTSSHWNFQADSHMKYLASPQSFPGPLTQPKSSRMSEPSFVLWS